METLKSRTGSGAKLNLLAFSQGLSSLGGSMATVALMLAFQAADASTWTVTLLLVLGLLPSVVLGPLVAPWLDRIETTKILTTTLTLRGLSELLSLSPPTSQPCSCCSVSLRSSPSLMAQP